MLMAISGARVIIKTKRRQFSLCAPFQVNSQPTVNVQYYPGSKSVLCIVWINQQMVSKYSMNAWRSLASRYLYHMKGLYYKCLMLRNLVQRESNHIPDLESFRFGLLIPRFGVNVCVCVDDNLRSHPQVCPTWLVFFFFPGRVSHWSEVCQGGHAGRPMSFCGLSPWRNTHSFHHQSQILLVSSRV